MIKKKLAAKFPGTAWLVLGGCGSAVLAAGFPELGIGFVGVALVFGLTVLTMAYAIGHVSDCHLNPGVTVGFWTAGRIPGSAVVPYIAAQVIGGIAIGLGLTLIHLISIPITNTSVNPARSTSQALFVGGWAMQQLWLFWVAPIAGGVLAGNTRVSQLQPIIAYQLGNGWSLSAGDLQFAYAWKASRWLSAPIGFQLGKVTKLAGQAVRLAVNPQYNLINDAGVEK